MSSFRADINGLRAVAVLAVLFYHFGIAGFGGGYVGVDVFFVISGYLMTQIICTKLARGQFSLMDFYIARARRILPALTALVVALLIGGAFYLPPMDYKQLGWQALSALTFVSNIIFSHRGDYFDTSSQESWLLHTWSLSVEWQFYLLLPLALMGLHKYKKGKFLKRGVICAFALSLIVGVAGTPLKPTEAFFLLLTRTWELLAGALVFFYGSRLSKIPYLAEAGLLCILGAVCFYSSETEFPGYMAILPVSGAALVIAAQSRNVFLSNKPAQFFGEISYSLYLWHWPVVVGAKYFDLPFTPLNIAIGLALVVVLSKISCSLIEEPFRHAKKKASPRFLLAGLGGCVLAAIFAGAIFFFNGLPTRVSADVREAELASDNKPARRGECSFDYKKGGAPPACIIGADVKPSATVWGDSHANAVSLSLGEALADKKRAAFIYSYAGCPPVLGSVFAGKWKKDKCREIDQATYDKTVSDPQIRDVFMVSRWSVYLHGYNEKGSPHPFVVFDGTTAATKENVAERAMAYTQKMVETMCVLTKKGKNVYVVAPIPEMGRNVPSSLAKSRLIYNRDAQIEVSMEAYRQRNREVLEALARAEKECRIHLLDPKPYICDAKACPGIRDGKALYSDDDHLSRFGNSLVKPMFIEALR